VKIAQLVNTLEFGGTERLVCDLALGLKARGHELTVVCLRTTGPLAGGLEKAGIEVAALGKSEGPSFGTVRTFRRLLRARGVEVVHSHNPLVHHYAVAARSSVTRVIVNTIHGIDNLARQPGAKERLYSLMCRFSERIVAVCPMAYRVFHDGGVIPKSRLMVINNGIPLAPYVRLAPRTADGEFRFGIVGRLVPVKDHASLITAFGKVAAQMPQARLEILGDGPLRAALEAQSTSLGLAARVRFHGFSDQVAEFFGSIDAAVLCSKSEGLPLSVLEAMASGLPIVGTSVGGIPDLVNEGRCGWLCAPTDPQSLANALLAAAQTTAPERVAMGERGRAHAQSAYSDQQMVAGYEKLFSDLLRPAG